jgi:hypothetical protein
MLGLVPQTPLASSRGNRKGAVAPQPTPELFFRQNLRSIGWGFY